VDCAVEAAVAGASTSELGACLAGAERAAEAVALGLHRGPESIEALRQASAEAQARKGARPRIYLAPWGPPAQHRAVVEFAVEFLETGGFEVIRGAPAESAEGAAGAGQDPARAVVICAARERIPEAVAALAPALSGRVVAVAGPPPAGEPAGWAGGVSEFIHRRADAVLVLTRLQRAMEVVS